jgi:hypothetical protein
VLRKIFGPKMEEVTEEWKSQHNEELCDLYHSLNIIRVIKSRRKAREGHVPRMGEGTGAYRVLEEKSEGNRDHLEDLRAEGRIILKWIFKTWNEAIECINLAQDSVVMNLRVL